MTKNRTEVADIDRSLYDFTYGEEGFERLDAGITPDIVREISVKKDEPQWMLDLRLKSLEIFNRFPDPTWGPSIEGLDMDNIVTYVKPNTEQKHDWESVPDDIKNTFERLGIPEAERSYEDANFHPSDDAGNTPPRYYTPNDDAWAEKPKHKHHPRKPKTVRTPEQKRLITRIACLCLVCF